MNIGNVAQMVLLLLSVATYGMETAAAEECDGAYFAADDHSHRFPLAKPAREFLASSKAAKQGDPVAQRSLAVSYETGYLVSPCEEKAMAWYAKAAAGGDEFAQKSLERFRQFSSLRNGPECLGSHCALSGSNATVTLQARGNHFYAPVSINGRTIEGVIDTGATLVSMSADSAKLFGIDYAKGNSGKSETANGVTDIKVVTVPSINVAGIALQNIEVSVGESKHPILIGMTFLKHVRTSIEGNTLTMVR